MKGSYFLVSVLILAGVASVALAANGSKTPANASGAALGLYADAKGANTNGKPSTNQADAPQGFFEILKAGGAVGFVIVLLSIAAAALVIEHLMTIRAKVLIPPELAEQIRGHLKAGQVNEAIRQCKLQPCLLSHVVGAGLSEIDGKWTALEKAMEDAAAEQSARLYRKIEYLSVIGNIAPMLGLLGTVIGMIFAFKKVATTGGGAGAGELAEGIYLALVTTVEGLIVAIPSLAAFAVFRNRVDQFVAEASHTALHVFKPFKRSARNGDAAKDETYRSPASPQS